MQPDYQTPPQQPGQLYPTQQPGNLNAPGMYPTPTQGPLAPMPGQAPVGPPAHHKPWGLIISLVVVSVLLLGALGFGFWAFSGMQDYKLNSDKKVATAVTAAKESQSATDAKDFAEKEKSPYKTYLGPATYGALNITYPKTWSAFVTETAGGSAPIDGYMHPNVVPGVNSGTAFALRFQVLAQTYANETKRFDALAKSGKVKVSPYRLPKMQDVIGIRVEGQINPGQQATMVVLPLRDKTVEISTQSATFVKDFDAIVLANFTFQP